MDVKRKYVCLHIYLRFYRQTHGANKSRHAKCRDVCYRKGSAVLCSVDTDPWSKQIESRKARDVCSRKGSAAVFSGSLT